MNCRSLLLTPIILMLLYTLAVAEPGHWAFEFPVDQNTPAAALDLRFLNEAYAGEHGFITRTPDGNGFARGDGQSIRFWGVTPRFEFGNLPIDSLRSMARFYAKMGMNVVRIHTQISPKTPGSQLDDYDSKEINDIQKIVAVFKEAGIYSVISPYWASSYFLQHVSKEWGIDGYEGEQHLWDILFFNEKLKSGYKSWVRALYTSDNPYTGVPLKDEPAVAIIQIQNEDGMFWWTVEQIKPEQKRILEGLYSDFIAKKYGSINKAVQTWKGESVEGDDPDNGVIKLYGTWEMTVEQTGGKAVRVQDQTEFLAALQYNFNKEITEYYRNDLGCQQIINPNNWFTASMQRLNDLERWTYSAAQVMAVNRYFTPGHVGENSGWRIDPGHFYVGRSALMNPASLISNIKQPVGYPFIISEGGWNLPSQNLAEAPFLTAAYQSLTGVDGLFWYTTLPPGYDTNPYWPVQDMIDGQPPLRRWSISIPQVLGLFPANALMYRMGYVQEGNPVVTEHTNLQALLERKVPPLVENSGFDPNRMTEEQQQNDQSGTINPLVFATGPVQIDLNAKSPSYETHPLLGDLINVDAKTVKSVTGELMWNYGQGLVTLNTDKAQGACGFNMGQVDLNDVSINCSNAYAAIQLVTLDDQPLAESKKILVQVGTRAHPTDWQQEPAVFGDEGRKRHGYKILNTGAMPWQIEDTDVTFIIKNPNLSKAILLDAALVPVRNIDVKVDTGLSVELPTDAMYIILQ